MRPAMSHYFHTLQERQPTAQVPKSAMYWYCVTAIAVADAVVAAEDRAWPGSRISDLSLVIP